MQKLINNYVICRIIINTIFVITKHELLLCIEEN